MVRGLRIFLPFPFTRNPVSSHLSITEKRKKTYVKLDSTEMIKFNIISIEKQTD